MEIKLIMSGLLSAVKSLRRNKWYLKLVGMIPSDIVTLTRSDWSDVKVDFGAVGDGVTDDTAAIQAAFDTIARGVTIYFPPGTYRVTSTLNIETASVLRGVMVYGHSGKSKLIWDGAAGQVMIQAEGMAYSSWIGLDLDGNNKASHPMRS